MASRNASTTRAQSFLEIIGPAVLEICSVTLSTRSALVISPSCSVAARPWTLAELTAVNSYVSRVCATSSRLLSDHVQKLLEERPGVVRAGRGLGVVLDSEHRQLAMT